MTPASPVRKWRQIQFTTSPELRKPSCMVREAGSHLINMLYLLTSPLRQGEEARESLKNENPASTSDSHHPALAASLSAGSFPSCVFNPTLIRDCVGV